MLLLLACVAPEVVVPESVAAPAASPAPTPAASPAPASPAVGDGAVGPPHPIRPRVSGVFPGVLSGSGGAWTFTPCGAPPVSLEGDPSAALTGLGNGPWQVVLAARPGPARFGLLDVGYASAAGDACTLPLPSARGSEPGWALAWTAQGGTLEQAGATARALPPGSWTLEPGPCHDAGSGAYYHRSAVVTADGATLRGCAVDMTATGP